MRTLALAAIAAVTTLAPSAASAVTTINMTSYSFALGAKDGRINLSGSPFDGQTANFGQFKLDGVNVSAGNTPITFYTYCVDLYHTLFVPGTFTIQPLSLLFNAAQAANMTKLLANVTPVNADQSAAVQLAMWEIAFDTNSTKDVASGGSQGLFYVTSGNSSSARTLANGYLANLGSWSVPAGGSAQLLYNAKNQSQIFFAVAPAVPETATWGMMIVGFGIVGASMRRRVRVTYSVA